MKRTLLAALTTLALVGCSHANKDAATADAQNAEQQGTESVAQSGDERIQAQESREASENSVYKGPEATGGSGTDAVSDPNSGDKTGVDNTATQGQQQTAVPGTESNTGATGSDSATGGSGGVQAKSDVSEEQGTGGSGAAATGAASTGAASNTSSTDTSSTGRSSMDAATDSTASDSATGGSGSMDTSTSTTHSTSSGTGGSAAPCPAPGTK
jgi:hypothetical protein